MLAQQFGPNAIVFALGGMVLIAFAAWIYQNTRLAAIATRYIGAGIATLALISAIGGGYAGVEAGALSANASAGVRDKANT